MRLEMRARFGYRREDELRLNMEFVIKRRGGTRSDGERAESRCSVKIPCLEWYLVRHKPAHLWRCDEPLGKNSKSKLVFVACGFPDCVVHRRRNRRQGPETDEAEGDGGSSEGTFVGFNHHCQNKLVSNLENRLCLTCGTRPIHIMGYDAYWLGWKPRQLITQLIASYMCVVRCSDLCLRSACCIQLCELICRLRDGFSITCIEKAWNDLS